MMITDRIKDMETVRVLEPRQCACKLCGQIRLERLPGYDYLSDEDANEYATEQCDCEQGKMYRHLKRRRENISNAIDHISNEDEFQMSDGTREIAKQAISLMFSDINSITIDDAGGTNIKIKKTSNEKIQIFATKKHTMKAEG